MEIWKNVKGYEGWYQISSTGNLRSVDRVIEYPNGSNKKWKGKVHSKGISVQGYVYYDLYKNQKRKRFLAHVLVYSAFNNDYDPRMDINHIDADKANNWIENLELVTRSQNMIHALQNNLLSKTIESATKHYVIDDSGQKISLKDLAKRERMSYSKVLSRFNKGYSYDEIIIKRKYNIDKYRKQKEL